MSELSTPIYDLDGKTNGALSLDPTVFGMTPNATLVHQALNAFLANRRIATAHTKDRSEVRGGGKKPWRQKGTGNARAGSIRSPLWRGGGITFGPTSERNFSKRLPQKMRHGAIKSVLSSKVARSQFVVVDSLSTLNGKTRSWINAAQRLPQPHDGKLIVSLQKETPAERSIRNVPIDKYVSLEGINIYDLLRYPTIVITRDAVDALTARLAAKQHLEVAA